ncbi:MAG: hypothetical protein RIG62_26185 [Cyclobacteriaceae bacterium]
MKFLFTLAALLGMATTVNYAQWNHVSEVNGAIYLSDGTELLTRFAYHEKTQALSRKDRLTMEVFTTFHVDSFLFYDPALNWQRRFKKLEYQQQEQFFEVVAPGRLEILRLKLPYNAPERIMTNELDRQALNYRYFVYQDGELSTLNGYNIKRLKTTHPQLWEKAKRYRREHDFSFYKLPDKMQIIEQINHLFSDEGLVQVAADRKPN